MASSLRIATVALFIGIGSVARAEEKAAVAPNDTAPRIEISKQTTYLTEPLTADGRINYIEAVDRAYAKGVTPENNGAVLLIRAFGPSHINKEVRDAYLKRLGLGGLPENGKYLVSLPEANGVTDPTEMQKLNDEMGEGTKREWSAEEFPRLLRWLETNEGPLKLIVAAAGKEKFYTPLVTAEGASPALIAVQLPTLQESREAARILTTRACYRLGRGDLAGAQEDLIACHRLGRMVSTHPTIIGRLVGIAIDAIATQADMVLANHPSLTAETALRYRARLQKLPPIGSMIDSINECERLMFLDTVAALAYGDTSTEDFAAVGPTAQAAQRMAQLLLGSSLDWNSILKKGNAFYDRVVVAGKKPTHLERFAALKVVEKDLAGQGTNAKSNTVTAFFTAALAPSKAITEQMGDTLLSLLAPALSQAMVAEERAIERQKLLDVAFALAAYRIQQGAYPASLAELQPKYLKDIPVDSFTGKPVKYRRDKSGYTLYSIGQNQKDDGGKTWDDVGLQGTR